MWRRAVSPQAQAQLLLRKLSPPSSAPSLTIVISLTTTSSATTLPHSHTHTHFSTPLSGNTTLKKVEDVMPIATGHEREELEAAPQGRNVLEINYPVGPFGTKDSPAIVKSVFDKRIVGCPGGEGEDEHDVVWFWLEKGKPHECPVCSQYFKVPHDCCLCLHLEVVRSGGPPDGHGDGHHH